METFSITRQQAKLKAFIVEYAARNDGVMPSYDEIASGMGWSSKGGVAKMLKALSERGHIEVLPGKARAIRVIGGAK